MPIKLTNANPDYYRTTIADATAGSPYERRTVIYSTIPLAIGDRIGASELIEQLPHDHNLTIYALDLVLATSLELPRGDIRIVCRTLTVPADMTVILDVSGRLELGYGADPYMTRPTDDGPINGRHGDDIAAELQRSSDRTVNRFGRDGYKGGSLTVICDRLVLDGQLELRADGSRGYPGCAGQDSHTVGGRGGNGGRGGKGGDGGRIELRYRTLSGNPPTTSAEARDAGPSGRPGRGGLFHAQGNASHDGEPAAPIASATGGTTIHDRAATAARVGRACDIVFLLKVLQQTKLLYLFNSPRGFSGHTPRVDRGRWKRIGEQLDWLADVLAAYVQGGVADPDAPYKQRICRTARTLAVRHAAMQTYFGREANHVPSLPFKKLVQLFRASSTNRSHLEKAFHKLVKSEERKAEAQLHLDETRSRLGAVASGHHDKFKHLRDERKDLVKRIEVDIAAFATASAALSRQLGSLRNAVVDHFEWPGWDSIFKAAEMMAFTVGGEGYTGALVMGGVEVANLIHEGMTKITTNEGIGIDKGPVVSSITAISLAATDGARGDLVRIVDGKQEVDPRKRILLAKLEDFETMVTGLSNALDAQGTPFARDTVTAIHAFRDAIKERGEAMLLYQLLTIRMVEEYEAYLEAKEQVSKLSGHEPESPAWISALSYVAKTYQDQLEQAAEDLAQLQRKFAYETLDHQDELNLEKTFGDMWLDGARPNAIDMNKIDRDVDDLERARARYEAGKESAPEAFPDPELGLNQRSDLRIEVPEGHPIIEELIRNGSCTFTAVSSSAEATPSNGKHASHPTLAVENSDQYYDIRISHVQPRVIGVSTSSHYLIVKVQLDRESTIYDDDGQAFTFAHSLPRQTSVRHALPAHLDDNHDLGTGGMGLLESAYLDQMGVFGTWTLSLPEQKAGDNAGLDRRGITALHIHFRGFRRTGAF